MIDPKMLSSNDVAYLVSVDDNNVKGFIVRLLLESLAESVIKIPQYQLQLQPGLGLFSYEIP